MARATAMARLSVTVLLLAVVAAAGGNIAPYPPPATHTWAVCFKLGSPCFYHEFPCPADCPWTCEADCYACKAVCPPPGPPPPPRPSYGTWHCTAKDTCFGSFRCPDGCPLHCRADCTACKGVCPCNLPGGLCQDPRFVGGDGLTFYFHGKKDQDFCIVSDSNLHINAHFIGRRNYNMKRDFTWVQSLGILFDNHQLYVGAQTTSTWDDLVDRLALAFDGEPIFLPATEGAEWRPSTAPGISFTRSSDVNGVVIEVEGNFKIKATVVPITEKDSMIHNYVITKEDCFAHLDLGFKFHSLSGVVNGVLGQTYRSNYVSKIKMGALMPVVGGAKEYASSSLFSTDCAVAKFTGQLNSSESFEYGSLECASTRMDGRGVVCKR
ncbi:hypothetical protein RHMOL_Rhmol13G0139800 [Rhododendron molle]|uniref:Uncharacterized protein n=1 Tax=Rhododendron molle TaxID=49168 RepID=A0ACC0L7E2_RHOML|nr:hypothetical protein RHMOL_Rhmol13G0139800 [Rhododendron molle]